MRLCFAQLNMAVAVVTSCACLSFAQEDAGTSPAADRDSRSAEFRNEIEPGVVVYGKSHRFAAVGSCQGFGSSPDGRTLAFASGKIKLFDLIDNVVTEELGEPREFYQSVAYSPDGRYVFGYSNMNSKGFVRVFDAIDGSSAGTIDTQIVAEPDAPRRFFSPQKMIVSADAKYIALQSYNEIQVREVATGELTMHLTDLGFVQDVGFSSDETELFVPMMNKFEVYDIATSEKKPSSESKFASKRGSFVSVNLSRDLIAIGQNNSVYIHDAKADKPLGTIKLPFMSYAQKVSFSDDGSMLAIGCSAQTKEGTKQRIHIVDVDTREVVKSVDVASQGLTKIVFSVGCRSLFVSGHAIYGVQEIRLDQADELKESKYPNGPITVGVVHPDGKSFVAGAQGGEVIWIDVATGDVLNSVNKSNLKSMTLSDDGLEILFSSKWGSQNPITRLNYETGKIKKEYAIDIAKQKRNSVFSAIRKFMANGGQNENVHHQVMPLSSRPSPDGKVINAVAMEMTIRMTSVSGFSGSTGQEREHSFQILKLDSDTGKIISSHQFPITNFGFGDKEWVQTGDIHPAGTEFLTIKSNKLKVGDTETGDVLQELDAGGHVFQAEYSPDGKFICVATQLGVRVWETASGAEVLMSAERGNPKFAFSRDGSRLAICPTHLNSAVEVFDTASWESVFSREKTEAERNSVALSNDGKKVMIGLADCRIEIWDLAAIR